MDAFTLPMTPVEALTRGFVFVAPAPGEESKPHTITEAEVPTEALTGTLAKASTKTSADLLEFGEEQHRQGFMIGTLNLMITYDAASQLIEPPAIFHLPNSPSWLLGMANLHGLIVPVFDLVEYFGCGQVKNAKKMVLVLGHAADAAGVLIDGLPERLHWNSQERTAVQADVGPARLLAHIKSARLIDERIWFDLNQHSLLEALELELQGL